MFPAESLSSEWVHGVAVGHRPEVTNLTGLKPDTVAAIYAHRLPAEAWDTTIRRLAGFPAIPVPAPRREPSPTAGGVQVLTDTRNRLAALVPAGVRETWDATLRRGIGLPPRPPRVPLRNRRRHLTPDTDRPKAG